MRIQDENNKEVVKNYRASKKIAIIAVSVLLCISIASSVCSVIEHYPGLKNKIGKKINGLFNTTNKKEVKEKAIKEGIINLKDAMAAEVIERVAEVDDDGNIVKYLSSYEEVLALKAQCDALHQEIGGKLLLEFDHKELKWGNAYVLEKDGKLVVYGNRLISDIPEFLDLTYEQLPKEYLDEVSQRNHITLSYLEHSEGEIRNVLQNFSGKDSFVYPDNSSVKIYNDGTVVRRDKDGKETTYKPGAYEKVCVYEMDGRGVIIWESSIDSAQSTVGGVERIITSDGELIEKHYIYKDPKTGNYLFVLKTSYGDEVYFGPDSYPISGVNSNNNYDQYGDISLPWIVNGNTIGFVRYTRHYPASWGVEGATLGAGVTVEWYVNDETDEFGCHLAKICCLTSDDAASAYGTVEKLGRNEYACTFDDGTVANFIMNDEYENHEGEKFHSEQPYNQLTSIDYTNGRTVEINSDKVTIKQDGKTLGSIERHYPVDILPSPACDICVLLGNDDNLWLFRGEGYKLSTGLADIEGTYEGGSLVIDSEHNEAYGYDDGLFTAIKGADESSKVYTINADNK